MAEKKENAPEAEKKAQAGTETNGKNVAKATAGNANNNDQQNKKPAEKARDAALEKAAPKSRKSASARKATKTKKARPVKQPAAKTGTTARKKPAAGRVDQGIKAKRQQSRNDSIFANMENLMNNTYQFDKLAQDAQNSGKEGIEAFVQSGSVFAKGFEDFMKTYVSWAQESAEKNSQAFKTLLSCKTLNEFTEAQSRLARENLDDFLNGVTKLSELSVKVTTDAFEPINDQFSKTIKKASESAAA